jgi:hypothetical protein
VKPINYTARFETVGDLYYRHSGRLRPGKSEPMATNGDSSDPENQAAFDEWMATLCFGAALDRIAELEEKVSVLEQAADA